MVIVTSADDPGKERVTRREHSTRNSSTGTEIANSSQSLQDVSSRACVSEKLNKQKTHDTQTGLKASRQVSNWRTTSVKRTSLKYERKHRSRKILCQVNRTLNVHINQHHRSVRNNSHLISIHPDTSGSNNTSKILMWNSSPVKITSFA